MDKVIERMEQKIRIMEKELDQLWNFIEKCKDLKHNQEFLVWKLAQIHQLAESEFKP